MPKKEVTNEDLERMTQGKYVCTQEIELIDKEVFGDEKKRKLTFNVYDGFAYCPNYKGKEYIMNYPRLEFVKICKQMEKEIREFCQLDDDTAIQVAHILNTYETLSEIKKEV